MNSVEYLIHEIGHALSVHVKPFAAVFVDGLPRRRMSTVVAAILRRRSDEGVHNECLVLAAEAVILPRLGLHVDLDELVVLGVDQGVEPAKLTAAMSSMKASTTWRSRIVRSHPSPLCQSRPL